MLENLPPTLLELLNNHIIFALVVPFLPTTSLLSLSSTSRAFRSLLFVTYPQYSFRRLDLSTLPFPFIFGQTSPAEVSTEGAATRHLTESEDDYYAAPLRRAFYVLKKKEVLDCVTTLILDGLAVPAGLVREILCDRPFNVRILSLRDVKNLGDEKLIQILRYLIRPTRPAGTPKLKALYYFTRPDSTALPHPQSLHPNSHPEQPIGVTNIAGSHLGQPPPSSRTITHNATWTHAKGTLFHPNPATIQPWTHLLEATRGLIAFDTIICHHAPGSSTLPPNLATIALGPEGCQTCHTAPEGPRILGHTPTQDLPLLPPPPLFASTVRAAQYPANGENTIFYARCAECVRERRCERCNVWWCEDCYEPPANKTGWKNPAGGNSGKIKVHMGLCVHSCLIEELYSGAGEGGMWG
ncbi:MAG: hypothetical protein Q9182_006659 [Xanthomendoza sp. 2 TL-2023]